jgi:hypothetical protein
MIGLYISHTARDRRGHNSAAQTHARETAIPRAPSCCLPRVASASARTSPRANPAHFTAPEQLRVWSAPSQAAAAAAHTVAARRRNCAPPARCVRAHDSSAAA